MTPHMYPLCKFLGMHATPKLLTCERCPGCKKGQDKIAGPSLTHVHTHPLSRTCACKQPFSRSRTCTRTCSHVAFELGLHAGLDARVCVAFCVRECLRRVEEGLARQLQLHAFLCSTVTPRWAQRVVRQNRRLEMQGHRSFALFQTSG